MPGRLLTNLTAPGWNPLPQAGWTIPVPPLNEQIVLEVVNTSGGTLQHGDVVAVDTSTSANTQTGWIPQPTINSPVVSPQAGGVGVTTTTTLNDPKVLGPITITGDASSNANTVAAGAACWVVIAGVARVQRGAQAVANVGDRLSASTAAKAAIGVPTGSVTAAMVGTFFGVALDTAANNDANATIRAIIARS